MTAQDKMVDWLFCQSDFSMREIDLVLNWWKASAIQDENLLTFLIRQGILRRTATQKIDLLEKGTMSPQDVHFFSASDLAHLRKRIIPSQETLVEINVTTEGLEEIGKTDPMLNKHMTWSDLQPGCVLGKCLLVDQVGEGGFGRVFRGVHQVFNIPVAVKVIQQEVLKADPVLKESLKQEAIMMAKLNHPNIVRVWDVDWQGEFPYLVAEYVEGLNLEELILNSGQLSLDRALHVMRQATEGLNAAWSLGIIHRDIKPANILVLRDGKVKVIDLGLALNQSQAADEDEIKGTVSYISPEQITSPSSVDIRSDIYSVGATFYHTVTGQPPFLGKTKREVMMKHLKGVPTPPHKVATHLPVEVSAFVERTMAKNPDERFQTAEELLTALKELESLGNEEKSNSEPDKSTFWKRIFKSFIRD